MKCPNCNSEVHFFRDKRREDPWYYRTCKACGEKFLLEGRDRLFSNFIILSIGLFVATFLEDFPPMAIIIALATIVVVIQRMFVLKPLPKAHKSANQSNQ